MMKMMLSIAAATTEPVQEFPARPHIMESFKFWRTTQDAPRHTLHGQALETGHDPWLLQRRRRAEDAIARDGCVQDVVAAVEHAPCLRARETCHITKEVRLGLATLPGHELQPALRAPRKLRREQVHDVQLRVVGRHDQQQDRQCQVGPTATR